jgi:hypothetical protein
MIIPERYVSQTKPLLAILSIIGHRSNAVLLLFWTWEFREKVE